MFDRNCVYKFLKVFGNLIPASQNQLNFSYKNENDPQNLSFYILSIVVEPDANTVAIESAVKERINGAQIARQHGKELAFRLPLSESDKFGGKICFTNQTPHNEISLRSFRCVYVFLLKCFSRNVSMRLNQVLNVIAA